MNTYSEIITMNPDFRSGKACIRNMRIAVCDILGWLSIGMSEKDIIKDYPELTVDDIHAALAYAAR